MTMRRSGSWADKIVYSKTLDKVSSARTRIEREFNPATVHQMKARSERDITVGGPDLAAQAIKAGLVDEYHLFITPVVVGGGKPSLPKDVRVNLELMDEHRFTLVPALAFGLGHALISTTPALPSTITI